MTTTEQPLLAAQQASTSSFYAAMRIMPRAQREAMFEIYSFCRSVDDIADNGGPRDLRLLQLQRWRDDIDSMYRSVQPLHLLALERAVRAYGLSREDFLAIIDGMEMDVVSTIRAPDFATLDLYCDRVASAVGRLSVCVFGMQKEAGLALAHHLGRALQLTNILRDLDEDAGIGRLYIPREALQDAHITATEPLAVLSNPALGFACAKVVARAEHHFNQSQAIMVASPRRVVRTALVMAAAYRMILRRLIARGWQAPRAPIRLRRRQFLWILLCYSL